MVTSRKIDDLLTPAKLRALNFIHACKEAGIDVLVTCTYRDAEEQDALYAQGRTRAQLDAHGLTHVDPRPGHTVTDARGGESFHQHRVALDVVPMRNGKPVWYGKDPVWEQIGAIGESCELEWAGRWVTFPEKPHFQFTGGLTIADFKAGKTIPPELTMPRSNAA